MAADPIYNFFDINCLSQVEARQQPVLESWKNL